LPVLTGHSKLLPGAAREGDASGLQTPQYDFDDQAISHGAGFRVRLIQDRTAL